VHNEERTPLDLPQLQRWLGQLIENYDALVRADGIGYSPREIRLYRNALISTARTCDGEFERPVKARIRELLALGAASYGLPTGPRPAESFPGQKVLDFAVYSLWPLATVPGLPSTWLGAFLDMTGSTAMASLIVRARYHCGTPEAMSPAEFGQALTGLSYTPGIRNMLDDLGDPRRAGAALTGIAIAHTGYAPRRGATQKRVAKWALLAAIGATVPIKVPLPRAPASPGRWIDSRTAVSHVRS
jgi:hypothetical protein